MSTLPEDKDLNLPGKVVSEDAHSLHSNEKTPPPIPKFTVFMLAVLCLLSLGTGIYYWYTTYYMPVGETMPAMAEVTPVQEPEDVAAVDEDEYLPEYEEYDDFMFAPPRPELDPRPQFVALWEQFGNEGIVGHLFIEGTELDEYIVHGQRNGAVFLDYDVDIFLDWELNIVIHGYDGSVMQSILREYFEYEFFLENPLVVFNTMYAEYEWEIFSFYVAPMDFPFAVVDHPFETWGDMVEMFTLASLYNTRLDVTEFDQILTLTTPTSTSAELYYVLQARLLRHITS